MLTFVPMLLLSSDTLYTEHSNKTFDAILSFGKSSSFLNIALFSLSVSSYGSFSLTLSVQGYLVKLCLTTLFH